MQRTVSSSIELLSQPRRAIVEYIKTHQPVRAEQIARDLNVTVSGIRQHLAALSAEGLVTHDVVRGQPGRPKHAFRLTDRGLELFPRNYAGLAAEMIEFVGEEDPEMLDRVFERRVKAQLDRVAPLLGDRPLKERVQVLVRFLNDEGFMAEMEERDDGTMVIVMRNCALLEVAKVNQHVCGSDLELLRRALPDANVDRTSHAIEDGPFCAYEVKAG